MMAQSSSVSWRSGLILLLGSMLDSTMSSNQNAVSSASSKTTPSFAMNSLVLLDLHAAR